jgi:hypothetical protein
MTAVVIQVDHGDGMAYMPELALMGPYRFRECWLNETYPIHLLEADPLWPRLIPLEPLNIRFVYPDEASNDFYALPHLTFSFLSDYTNNRVGYVDVPFDSLAALELGDRVLLDDESLELLEAAGLKHR